MSRCPECRSNTIPCDCDLQAEACPRCKEYIVMIENMRGVIEVYDQEVRFLKSRIDSVKKMQPYDRDTEMQARAYRKLREIFGKVPIREGSV